MSLDPTTPENNLILRQLQAVRRESRETQEREARVIELLGRVNQKLDDLESRIDRGMSEIRSDLVLWKTKL